MQWIYGSGTQEESLDYKYSFGIYQYTDGNWSHKWIGSSSKSTQSEKRIGSKTKPRRSPTFKIQGCSGV